MNITKNYNFETDTIQTILSKISYDNTSLAEHYRVIFKNIYSFFINQKNKVGQSKLDFNIENNIYDLNKEELILKIEKIDLDSKINSISFAHTVGYIQSYSSFIDPTEINIEDKNQEDYMAYIYSSFFSDIYKTLISTFYRSCKESFENS